MVDNRSYGPGGLRIDRARREVTVDERSVHLTPIEYKLLVYLATNAGKVCTHKQMLRAVWGANRAAQAHYVRVFMQALRKKPEDDPSHPTLEQASIACARPSVCRTR